MSSSQTQAPAACYTSDCTNKPSTHDFCRSCWALVPEFYRRELGKTYRAGMERQGRAYLQHQMNARRAVETAREGIARREQGEAIREEALRLLRSGRGVR